MDGPLLQFQNWLKGLGTRSKDILGTFGIKIKPYELDKLAELLTANHIREAVWYRHLSSALSGKFTAYT